MFITYYKGYRVTVSYGRFYGFLDHNTPVQDSATLRGVKYLITRAINKGNN